MYDNSIKLMYTNDYKKHYYLLLANFIVDYKEQVIIMGIKANMQYLIYYISPKKEN